MAWDGEGVLYIPLEDFRRFALKYLPKSGADIVLGIPRIEDDLIAIDWAASTICNPIDWAEKPKAITQWNEKEKD
jgi:hypothetical protein